MEILLLTVFLSLLLASLFLLLFLRDKLDRGLRSLEQDSLRPFQPEEPRKANKS